MDSEQKRKSDILGHLLSGTVPYPVYPLITFSYICPTLFSNSDCSCQWPMASPARERNESLLINQLYLVWLCAVGFRILFWPVFIHFGGF